MPIYLQPLLQRLEESSGSVAALYNQKTLPRSLEFEKQGAVYVDATSNDWKGFRMFIQRCIWPLADWHIIALVSEGLDEPLARRLFDILQPTAYILLPCAQLEPCPLTRRQLQVVQCVSQGLVGKAIAKKLYMGPDTVQTHILNAKRRLDITGPPRTLLVAECIRRGYL